MNDSKYTISHIVKNEHRSNDLRGSIISIVDYNINNVSIISCNKGSIRSNHYHLKDSHYIYILKGKMEYYYSKLKHIKINKKIVHEGEIVFTPALEIHATKFLENSIIIVISMHKRSKKFYSKDTIKYDLI